MEEEEEEAAVTTVAVAAVVAVAARISARPVEAAARPDCFRPVSPITTTISSVATVG